MTGAWSFAHTWAPPAPSLDSTDGRVRPIDGARHRRGDAVVLGGVASVLGPGEQRGDAGDGCQIIGHRRDMGPVGPVRSKRF